MKLRRTWSTSVTSIQQYSGSLKETEISPTTLVVPSLACLADVRFNCDVDCYFKQKTRNYLLERTLFLPTSSTSANI
jgi:hypothetical protein